MVKKRKLIKVVYFDEMSALDYVDINKNGRWLSENETERKVSGGAGASANVGTPRLLSGVLKASANGDLAVAGSKITKSQVSNTILTDFLKVENRQKNFSLFEGYKLKITQGSITYLKTISPLTDVFKGSLPVESEGAAFDIEMSKISSAINGLVGYSEFVAEKDSKQYVFRFNDSAFRNSYRLLDIPKMSVSLYGVRVGEVAEEDLRFDSLNSQQEQAVNTQDIIDSSTEVGDGGDKGLHGKRLEVYDIILAGIFNL